MPVIARPTMSVYMVSVLSLARPRQHRPPAGRLIPRHNGPDYLYLATMYV